MKRSQAITGLVLLTVIGYSQTAIAQVVPDNTVGTIVSPGPVFNITGGTRPSNGPNLFHSFSQFSLPTGSSAIFQNDPAVQTIFSRITGGSRSDINGLIQTQGTASLFLMNPNGILFGPNAKLELGGSFVGTTANSIKFEDGVEFSAGNLTSDPLLTVKVPIGLHMGQTPGAIQNASKVPSLVPFAPFLSGGLQVRSGQSLSLLGGAVSFTGGGVSALNGQIEIGAVGANSFVGLVPQSFGFGLNYDRVQTFQDVKLTGLSLLDARDGGVQVRGRQISLLNGPHILTDLMQGSTSRGMVLNATESIQLSGFTSIPTPSGPRPIPVYLSSATPRNRAGIGGSISLMAPTIAIADRATVFATVMAGNGGNIAIQANQLNVTNGFILTRVSGSGQGGDILLKTDQLNVLDAAQIGAGTDGDGNSGNFMIQAKDVQVSGLKFAGFPVPFNSVLFTTTTKGTGKGGTLTLQTERLRVTDGGIVATTTFGRGNAGDLIVRASDFVELARANKQSPYPTGLVADAARISVIPQTLEGNGGNIQVTTGRLMLEDGGAIAVGNPGRGDSGNILINAQSVSLKAGTLDATIVAGNKGNITINTDVLLMRDRSTITTNASSRANGGEIFINAPVIVGLENSDIIANASQGRGGSITITTQGLFGLQYRDRLTPDNDITASSEFGINGSVQVNTIGINPTNALNELPVDIIDSSRQIADRCAAAKTSSFIATGRGGIPQNPTKKRASDRPWNDLRFNSLQAPAIVQPIAEKTSQPIVEATAFQIDAMGVILLTTPKNTDIQPKTTCGMANPIGEP